MSLSTTLLKSVPSAFGRAKGRGELQKECSLEFSNSLAGSERVTTIQNILKRTRDVQQDDYFDKLGVDVKEDAVVLPAKLLPQPHIFFANGATAAVEDGQWRSGSCFCSSAPLNSFAVLDFSRKEVGPDVVRDLFHTLASYGSTLDVLGGKREAHNLIESVYCVADLGGHEFSLCNKRQVKQASLEFEEAIKTARDTFLGKSLFEKSRTNKDGGKFILYRRALVRSPQLGRALVECLVIPSSGAGQKVELIAPTNIKWDTHIVDGYPARVMYQIRNKQELIDPFDVHFMESEAEGKEVEEVLVGDKKIKLKEIARVFEGTKEAKSKRITCRTT